MSSSPDGGVALSEVSLAPRSDRSEIDPEHGHVAADLEIKRHQSFRSEDTHTKSAEETSSSSDPSSPPSSALTPPPTTPLSKLIQLTWHSDWWKFIIAVFCAICQGGSLPAFSVVFGELFNAFFSPDPEFIKSETLKYALIFLGVGGGTMILAYLQVMLFTQIGSHITSTLRSMFFRALLLQEGGYFDMPGNETGALTSKLSTDSTLVQVGVSEKYGQSISLYSQLIGGVIVAFVYGWKLTLVLIAISPLVMMTGFLQFYFLTKSSQSSQKAFESASVSAQECLSGIKTVISFNQQERQSKEFDSTLTFVHNTVSKDAHLSGLGFGFSMLSIFSVYCIGFWYGGRLVADGDMKAGNVLTVFFSIVIGAMGLGQASQLNPDFIKARVSAYKLFEIIEREPLVSYNTESGIRPLRLEGRIEFENVRFAYPSRPDSNVLNNINITIQPGQSIALVGQSGSGKSTCISLIERFYDVSEGRILIDGIDIREYNLYSLRDHISLVAQEPVLFSGSIADNISYGCQNASMEEIVQAAKQANAHNFITELSEGYQTQVGEKGLQLSGGQRQRIAISRALLKSPEILCLDEATSALDSESEHLVQQALSILMRDRTSITIAHRLSTVIDADVIFVMNKGNIVEFGTHNELLAREGFYANLVAKQLRGSVSSESSSEDEQLRVE